MIDLDFLFYLKNMTDFSRIGEDEAAEPFVLPTDELIQKVKGGKSSND